jgi:hypothetical protein
MKSTAIDRTGTFPRMRGMLILALTCCVTSLTQSHAIEVLYTNGPIQGTTDAAEIFGNVQVSNSFVLGSDSTLQSITGIGIWAYLTDPQTVSWAIQSTPFGTDLYSGTSAPITKTFIRTTFDLEVYDASLNLGNLNLAAGTYWLTLKEAGGTGVGAIYWDINNGISSAFKKSGTDAPVANPSNSFVINGIAVPEPSTYALATVAVIALGVVGRRHSTRKLA